MINDKMDHLMQEEVMMSGDVLLDADVDSE